MAGWEVRASAPFNAAFVSIAQIQPNVFMFVCPGEGIDSLDNGNWSYNATTDTWTQRANIPFVVNGPAVAPLGTDEIIMITGARPDGVTFVGLPGSVGVWKYNITTNVWTQLANAPVASTGGTAANVGGIVYWSPGANTTFFGDTPNGIYQFSGGAWSTKNSSLRLPGQFVYDNKIWGPWDYYTPATNVETALPADLNSGEYSYSYPELVLSGVMYFMSNSNYVSAELRLSDMNVIQLVNATAAEAAHEPSRSSDPVYPGQRSNAHTFGTSTHIYAVCGYVPDASMNDYRGTNFNYRYNPLLSGGNLTGVTPAAGSLVNTDLATLGVQAKAHGERNIVAWQVARDSGYTTSARTFLDAEVTYVENPYAIGYGTYETKLTYNDLPGLRPFEIPAGATELFQGLWFIRARQQLAHTLTGWVGNHSFTVSHPPAGGTVSPIGDQTLDYGTNGAVNLKWSFTDTSPTDIQSAYQIIVERASDASVLLDTGKVITQTARERAWNVTAANKDVQLRWKIMLWDSDDVAGNYSSYALFRMSDKPVANVTAPAEAGTVNTGRPTITWTFTASGGRTQAKSRVYFRNASNTIIHDSGDLIGAGLSYTPPIIVVENGNYSVQVVVTDNVGLTGTDSNNFTTSYDPPSSPTFTVSTTFYASKGYTEILWGNANIDAAFISYRVYRIGGNDETWRLIHEIPYNQGSYSYKDYSAGSGITYHYVVVQAVTRFGNLVESLRAGKEVEATGTSSQYWLVNERDETQNVELRNVTADDFVDEFEQEQVLLIGRGRHIDYGTHWGYKGQLTVQVRDISGGPTAREIRQSIEALRNSLDPIYLRNPFGDVWAVNVADLPFTRMSGVGRSEFGDLTIPYVEVK